MGWFDRMIGRGEAASAPAWPHAGGGPNVRALSIESFGDPYLEQFMRSDVSGTGQAVNARTVLRNAGVFRCVALRSNAIAMLPLTLMRAGRDGERDKASEHPLYDVLSHRPNNWQTAFVFRRLMQHRVLTRGNAYARVIRVGGRVTELIPLDPDRIEPVLQDDLTLRYRWTRAKGGQLMLQPEDVLHLMGPSEDGLKGLALVDYAAEVLGLALAAQRSAAKTFRQGITAGGTLTTDKTLTPEAIDRLRDDMESRFAGSDNAGKWMILEQGLNASPFQVTAKDSQNIETRQHQIEEVARIFGVPRPFLMVDDTSWGSGIEQLGIFFVQYGLAPDFACWEQAIERTLLTRDERRSGLYAKFNERALLRGSMKDQADFFAKALGAGGGRAWMTQDEVRGLSDLAPVGGAAAELSMGLTSPKVTIGGMA